MEQRTRVILVQDLELEKNETRDSADTPTGGNGQPTLFLLVVANKNGALRIGLLKRDKAQKSAIALNRPILVNSHGIKL